MIRAMLSSVLAGLMLASQSGAAEPATRPRPNVVVFVVDDLGALDLGYTGSKFYESPNIDALAKRGAVFTAAYASCPVCSPTRASLMTGKYPQRVGITDFIGGPQPDEAAKQPKYRDRLLPAPYREELALEQVTVGEAFKEAGYSTFFAGKWHLGREAHYPDKQGFDVTFGAGHQGNPGKGGYFSPYKVPLSPGPDGEHLDLRLASEGAKWLKAHGNERPFLMWLSWYDVHTPLMAPPATIAYFEDKKKRMNLTDEFGRDGESKVRLTQAHTTYAAMVKTMDDAIGIIVRQLEEQKLLDDAVILFTSDNGGLSTSEGSPTSNAPLRAGKGWPYEGGVRVPMFAIVPGVTRAGQTCSTRAISMDVFPTLLAACGLPPREADHLDGVNLLPALRGEKLPDRPLFWHYPHYGNQGGRPYSGMLDGNWKLIVFHDPRLGAELHNEAADPSEVKNLAATEPDRVAAMRKQLDAWKRDVGAVDATPHAAAAAN